MNHLLLSQRAFSLAIILGLTAVMLTSYQNCGQAQFTRQASNAQGPVSCIPSFGDPSGICSLQNPAPGITGSVRNGKDLILPSTGIPDTCAGLKRSEVTSDPAATPIGLNRIVTIEAVANGFNPLGWECTVSSPNNGQPPQTGPCRDLQNIAGLTGLSCSYSEIHSGAQMRLRCERLHNSDAFAPEHYHIQIRSSRSGSNGPIPSNTANFRFAVNNCPNAPIDPPPLPDDFAILGVLGQADNAADQFLAGPTANPIIRVQGRPQYSTYNIEFKKRPPDEFYISLAERFSINETGDLPATCNQTNLPVLRQGTDVSGQIYSDIELTGCDLNLERVKLFVEGVKSNGSAVSATYPNIPGANTPLGLAVRVMNNSSSGTPNDVLILGVHKPSGSDNIVDRILSNENQNPTFQVYNWYRLDPSLTGLRFRVTVRKQSNQALLCNEEERTFSSVPTDYGIDLPMTSCPDSGVFALTSLANTGDDYEVEVKAEGLRGSTVVPYTTAKYRFDVIGPVAQGFSILGIAAAPGEQFQPANPMNPPKIRRTDVPVLEVENPNPNSPANVFDVNIYGMNDQGQMVVLCGNTNITAPTVMNNPNLALALNCPSVLIEGNYEAEVVALDSGRRFPAMTRMSFMISPDSLPDGRLLEIGGILGATDMQADNQFTGSGLPWVRVEAVDPNSPLNYTPPRFWLTIMNSNSGGTAPGTSAYCARRLLTPEALAAILPDVRVLLKTLVCDTSQGSPVNKNFYAVVEAANNDGSLSRPIAGSPYRFKWVGEDYSSYIVTWVDGDPVRQQAPNMGQAPVMLNIPLRLNRPAPAGGITVQIEAEDGYALHNEDFRVESTLPGTIVRLVTFAEGSTTANYPIAVLPDPLNEVYNFQPGITPNAETVSLNIVYYNNFPGTPGINVSTPPNTKQLRIEPSDDNSWPPPPGGTWSLQVTPNSPHSEGSTASVALCYSGTVRGALRGTITIQADTGVTNPATPGTDLGFGNQIQANVILPTSSSGITPTCSNSVSINFVDDMTNEPEPEGFQLALTALVRESNPTQAVNPRPSAAYRGRIQDNNNWIPNPMGWRFEPVSGAAYAEGTTQAYKLCHTGPLMESVRARVQTLSAGLPTAGGAVVATVEGDYSFPGPQLDGGMHSVLLTLPASTREACSSDFVVTFNADKVTEGPEVFGFAANQLIRVSNNDTATLNVPAWGQIYDDTSGLDILGIVGMGDDKPDAILSASDRKPFVRVTHGGAYYKVEIKSSPAETDPGVCPTAYLTIPREPMTVDLKSGCENGLVDGQTYYAFVRNGNADCRTLSNCARLTNSPFQFRVDSSQATINAVLAIAPANQAAPPIALSEGGSAGQFVVTNLVNGVATNPIVPYTVTLGISGTPPNFMIFNPPDGNSSSDVRFRINGQFTNQFTFPTDRSSVTLEIVSEEDAFVEADKSGLIRFVSVVPTMPRPNLMIDASQTLDVTVTEGTRRPLLSLRLGGPSMYEGQTGNIIAKYDGAGVYLPIEVDVELRPHTSKRPASLGTDVSIGNSGTGVVSGTIRWNGGWSWDGMLPIRAISDTEIEGDEFFFIRVLGARLIGQGGPRGSNEQLLYPTQVQVIPFGWDGSAASVLWPIGASNPTPTPVEGIVSEERLPVVNVTMPATAQTSSIPLGETRTLRINLSESRPFPIQVSFRLNSLTNPTLGTDYEFLQTNTGQTVTCDSSMNCYVTMVGNSTFVEIPVRNKRTTAGSMPALSVTLQNAYYDFNVFSGIQQFSVRPDRHDFQLAVPDASGVTIYVTDPSLTMVENSSSSWLTWINQRIPYPIELFYRFDPAPGSSINYGPTADIHVSGLGTGSGGEPNPDPVQVGNGEFKVQIGSNDYTYRGQIVHPLNDVQDPEKKVILRVLRAHAVTPVGNIPVAISATQNTSLITLSADTTSPPTYACGIGTRSSPPAQMVSGGNLNVGYNQTVYCRAQTFNSAENFRLGGCVRQISPTLIGPNCQTIVTSDAAWQYEGGGVYTYQSTFRPSTTIRTEGWVSDSAQPARESSRVTFSIQGPPTTGGGGPTACPVVQGYILCWDAAQFTQSSNAGCISELAGATWLTFRGGCGSCVQEIEQYRSSNPEMCSSYCANYSTLQNPKPGCPIPPPP